MKRTLLILSFVVTLFVAGVLFGNHLQSEEKGTISWEEAYGVHFPETMPDLILDPMVGYPVY